VEQDRTMTIVFAMMTAFATMIVFAMAIAGLNLPAHSLLQEIYSDASRVQSQVFAKSVVRFPRDPSQGASNAWRGSRHC
jgi:hypothetical protein